MNFLDQINAFYDVVADDSTSELYPLANVKNEINAGEAAFINYKVRWSFLEDDLLRRTIADTTLASAYTAGGASLTLTDSSTYPTASSTLYGLVCEGDILETWTGNAANVLSGVSGFQLGHAVDKDVKPIYKIPSTINKPTRIFVDGSELEYSPYENWDGANTFTIYQDYIFIPENDGDEILRIPYYKRAVTLTADDDESLLPEEYRMAPVYYALGKMLLATDEISKARQYCYLNPNTQVYEGFFGEMLQMAMRRFGSKTVGNKRRIKVSQRLQSK